MTANPNRIELESQILCSSLRQSWEAGDAQGVIKVAKQLYQLFPDLLPPLTTTTTNQPGLNLYEILNIDCNAPQTSVIANYLRSVRKYLKVGNVKEKKDDYCRLLNCGYILRKPRLRLSHDLTVARDWLLSKKAIPADGTLDFIQPVYAAAKQPAQPVPPSTLPSLVNLLQAGQIIGAAEVQALINQMNAAPEIPVQELILNAGYVTDLELKSLQLAEYLLAQGKITMAQFAVAMYDERTQGVRMAESLQNRGWLETHVKTFSGDGN